MKEQRDLPTSQRGEYSGLQNSWYKRAVSILFTFLLALVSAGTIHPGNSPDSTISDIQDIIGDFLLRLEISEDVQIRIEPDNQRLVSVERVRNAQGGFLMSFDERFLAGLTHEELRATIAHEIGHIWIFTHHPYLQTEELANKIALKLVPRESLEQIYERVAHAVPRATFQEVNHLPPPEERITP